MRYAECVDGGLRVAGPQPGQLIRRATTGTAGAAELARSAAAAESGAAGTLFLTGTLAAGASDVGTAAVTTDSSCR